MKSVFSGLITAFSMYSWIPMPQLEWRRDTMKYALCFFPLVGAVSGAAAVLWAWLAGIAGVNLLLFSGIALLIPVFITGAIHVDGFIDTCDALYSRQDREKKLEILKDPHVGAFGVISCVCYMLLMLCLISQVGPDVHLFVLVALGSVISRAMSAFSIVTIKTAKNSGLAFIFADNAHKNTVRTVSVLIAAAALAAMAVMNPLFGVCALLISAAVYSVFLRICYKQFGGITGDLAGFMLQLIELGIMLSAVITSLIQNK